MTDTLVTKQDVAAKAGVSMRTVFRVISDPGLVDAETRTKVEAAIEELGFTGETKRRGRKPFEIPLTHPIALRVDGRTREELVQRAEVLTRAHGARSRGWDAEIVRLALDWAFYPPEGVEPMPDDYLGFVDRITTQT